MSDEKLPPSRTAPQFIVRFPEGMREQIAQAARANNRSINAEILARLQAALELQEEVNELRAGFAGAHAQLADISKRLEYSELERDRLRSENATLQATAQQTQEQLKMEYARRAEAAAAYERAASERLQERETYRELLRKAEASTRGELERVRADVEHQRLLAEERARTIQGLQVTRDLLASFLSDVDKLLPEEKRGGPGVQNLVRFARSVINRDVIGLREVFSDMTPGRTNDLPYSHMLVRMVESLTVPPMDAPSAASESVSRRDKE